MSKKIFAYVVITILMFSVFMMLGGCRPTKNGNSQQHVTGILQAQLGTAYDTAYNATREFLLGQQQRTGDHIHQTIRYIVIRLSDMKIVREGSYRNGFARWINATKIEITETTPGQESKRQVVSVQDEM